VSVVVSVHGGRELEADASGADEAEDGRAAHIALEQQQRVADEHRHGLRQDPVLDDLAPGGADRFHRRDGTAVHGLHRLGEDLADGSDGSDRHGEDSRERAEPDGRHEHQRDDEIGQGANDVHRPAAGVVQPPRCDVARGSERDDEGEHGAEHGSDDRHLQRLEEEPQDEPDLREVGREHAQQELAHVRSADAELQEIELRAVGRPQEDRDGQHDADDRAGTGHAESALHALALARIQLRMGEGRRTHSSAIPFRCRRDEPEEEGADAAGRAGGDRKPPTAYSSSPRS
jgi:hypothetical protein